MVLAAKFLVVVLEWRGREVKRRSRRPVSIPPEAQVQGLFSKQCLDQRQVEARHTPTIKHQDLIARTQTWKHRQARCQNIGGENDTDPHV